MVHETYFSKEYWTIVEIKDKQHFKCFTLLLGIVFIWLNLLLSIDPDINSKGSEYHLHWDKRKEIQYLGLLTSAEFKRKSS